MSALEDALLFQIKALKLPVPEREHKFHAKRRWRFDLAWPDKMLAVECEGGVWSGGRHSTGIGFTADCEKYAEAVLLEWRVLRFTGDQINSGYAIGCIVKILGVVDE